MAHRNQKHLGSNPLTTKKKITSKKKPSRSKKSKVTPKATSSKPTKKKTRAKSDENKVSATDGRRTNNLSRVNRIRKTNADEIRKKFKAKEYVKQLEQSAKQLLGIIEDLNIAKQLKAKLSKKEKDKLAVIRMQIDVLMVQRDTIKVHIDLNLRRLKYCIPELRSVELTDPYGDSPFASFAAALTEAAKT